MKKMKDYHDLYLKCEVLFVVDVFKNFRNGSLKNYRLCPSHYLSAPALRCGAMLNITKVEHELFQMLTCIYSLKKLLEVEFYISKRYTKANNNYLKSYDPKQKSKHVLYLDANNLYDYVMSKFQTDSNE